MPDFGRRSSNGDDPSLDDVNRVDQFFDALGARQTPYSTGRTEAELAYLLSDWRDDIRDTPSTVPVTTRDATAALGEGLSQRVRRGRASLALVGSVAAAVLCIGGFGAAVVTSGPGDALYGMRSALFGREEVRDDQVSLASQQLQQVQQLVDQGQWQQAQDKLVELSSRVQNVEAPPQQKQDLIQQWNALSYKVVEQDAAAALPPAGEPLPALPNSPLTLLPVPAVSTSTTTSPSTTAESTTSPDSTTPSTPSTPSTSSPTATTQPTTTTTTAQPTATTTQPPTTTTTAPPTTTTTTQPATTAQPATTTAQPAQTQTTIVTTATTSAVTQVPAAQPTETASVPTSTASAASQPPSTASQPTQSVTVTQPAATTAPR